MSARQEGGDFGLGFFEGFVIHLEIPLFGLLPLIDITKSILVVNQLNQRNSIIGRKILRAVFLESFPKIAGLHDSKAFVVASCGLSAGKVLHLLNPLLLIKLSNKPARRQAVI